MTSLRELGILIDAKVVGNPEIMIDGVSSLDDGKASTISYLYSKKYEKFIDSTEAAAIVVSDKSFLNNKHGLVVKDPRLAFVKILDYFSEKSDEFIGIDKSAQISTSSKIGTNVNIGPNVVIGEKVFIGDNVTIGANSVIGAQSWIGINSKIYCNVHLYQNSIIGSDWIIYSGVVIGADGYGFISSKDDHVKIPQLGKVVIGNNVEIGANSTILPNTKVKNNTQISVNSIIKKNITKSNIRVVSFPIK